ncbi:mitochondrial ribosomal death-associated protein 3-domain-containing protein [Favolaschia claudopus]|uniref:Small ribosomal subunit protein mS29 n=1 Tax=Favolaschia claudopus TaxID=2862362 RepID=A0AAW0BS77_9AGAR
MFLLGRGLLGPPPLLRFGVRYKKKKSAYAVASPNQNAKGKNGKAVIQRDAMGRPIVKQREKSLGTFRPLGAGGLTHELFESDGPGRVELDVAPLRPRMLAPGIPTRFHDMDPTSPIRVYGMPKHMLLEFRMLGAPCSITTSTTLSLIRALEESKDAPARLALNGRSGVGKSFLVLQTAQYAAASRQWIVLYIPRARHFVDSTTPYQYSLASRTYLQPRAAYQTLSRLARANAHLLRQLKAQTEIALPDGGRSFSAGTPLTDVINTGLGASGEAPSAEVLLRAPFVLEAVLSELGAQEQFPVLIAIDDFQALCGRSLYKDPRFRPIRPHHLSMPRLLLEYAGGRKKLARGLVLTALTRSDPQFPVPPQLADALRLGDEFTPSPRSVNYRRSAQLAAYLEGEVEEHPDPFAFLDLELSEDADSELASASETADESSLDETELAEDEQDPQWTGWTAYDLPAYEDSVSPDVVDPFPVPKPTEEWRTMVLPRENGEDMPDDAEELGGLVDTREDVEGEVEEVEEDGSLAEEQEEQQEMVNKSRGGQNKVRMVRALRAVRVPDALTVREAAGLFEVWMDAGVLRTGGQRRLASRTELDTQQSYSAIKKEVDTDPETAYDSELVDSVPSGAASSSLNPPPFAFPAQPQVATNPSSFSSIFSAKSLEKRSSANATPATPESEEAEFARLQAELKSGEYAEVRLLEQDIAGEKWKWERAVEDVRVESLDATSVRELRAAEQEAMEGEEGVVAEADNAVSAEEDFVRAAEALAHEGGETDAAVETPLDLGSDPQIARLVSEGVRDALADPESVADLLRTNVANADEILTGHETIEGMEDEDDDEDAGRAVSGVKVEDESGADELFLSKYLESSGNARTFVKGLIGTLQTS